MHSAHCVLLMYDMYVCTYALSCTQYYIIIIFMYIHYLVFRS